MSDLVTIENLSIAFKTRNGIVDAVSDVSLTVAKGEMLGIVGESGSGKSVTSYALMRILDRAGAITGGRIVYSGIDVHTASERQMGDLRGREMSMIFQNPRSALNPIRKVGHQIEDVLIEHAQETGVTAHDKAIELLKLVKIRDAGQRYHAYPFELSGGMCQRVVIALALACRPQLLIADEPTTGLDVTTQKAIMDLVVEITHARGMSVILITHDLGLAAAYCDRIIVMQAGEVLEAERSDKLFAAPKHPYTQKLIRATPRPGCEIRDLLSDQKITKKRPKRKRATKKPQRAEHPLLKVNQLVKEFPIGKATTSRWLERLRGGKKVRSDAEVFRAVDNISFEIPAGSSMGLVGESGCGKSTTSAMLMRLMDPTSGSIQLDGAELTSIPVKEFARCPHRAELQMVFQDPLDSLNPRFTAARAISDPLRMLATRQTHRAMTERVRELASLVNLPPDLLERFPHQLSGGQRARVGIARAIALNPKLLILDEPTAALDVSVQAVVLNLLSDLREKLGMSYLFISHDLNVVRLLCDEILVMKEGRVVERGSADKVMQSPKDDYTRRLIEAIPHPPA